MNAFLRFGLMTLGIIFLVVGIIGLFLPILQGILFLIAGIYLLSVTSLKCKALLTQILSRYPRVKRLYDTHTEKLDKILKRE
jgi:uncharacterized protein